MNPGDWNCAERVLEQVEDLLIGSLFVAICFTAIVNEMGFYVQRLWCNCNVSIYLPDGISFISGDGNGGEALLSPDRILQRVRGDQERDIAALASARRVH